MKSEHRSNGPAAMPSPAGTPRPSLLFRQTPSGGVLLDIAEDRFYILSDLSARLWSAMSQGESCASMRSVIPRSLIGAVTDVDRLIERQLSAWRERGLLDAPEDRHALPVTVRQAGCPAAVDFAGESSEHAHLSPFLMAGLAYRQRRYERRLRTRDLAGALRLLPSAKGATRLGLLPRVLRAYAALRRPHRQGEDAHDCLPRSLALADTLRRSGFDADVCIGITDLPFLSHSWVEWQGVVLNERATTVARYSVIGRF